jgi:hypothetical protein
MFDNRQKTNIKRSESKGPTPLVEFSSNINELFNQQKVSERLRRKLLRTFKFVGPKKFLKASEIIKESDFFPISEEACDELTLVYSDYLNKDKNIYLSIATSLLAMTLEGTVDNSLIFNSKLLKITKKLSASELEKLKGMALIGEKVASEIYEFKGTAEGFANIASYLEGLREEKSIIDRRKLKSVKKSNKQNESYLKNRS